jgi:purine-binding chemotaxis protein CheW
VSAAEPARSLTDRLQAGEAVRLVTFLLDGRAVGCAVEHVEEVVHDPRMHPLPAAPAHLLGVLRLRGELLPVLDIAPALALPALGHAGAAVIIDDGRRRFGIAATDVGAIAEVDGAQVRLVHGERDAMRGIIGYARTAHALLMLVEPAETVAGLRTPTPQESS